MAAGRRDEDMKDLSAWQDYPATREMYDTIREDILANAQAAGIPARKEFTLELGIEEMLINIITYVKIWKLLLYIKRAKKRKSLVSLIESFRITNSREANMKTMF